MDDPSDAEGAEVLAKDANAISLRASAKTFASSAFKKSLHWLVAPLRW